MPITSFNESLHAFRTHYASLAWQPFDCVSDKRIWLFTHFITARLIDTLSLINIFAYMWLLIPYSHFCSDAFHSLAEGTWTDLFDRDARTLRMIILKKELKLIFTYVSLAYLCTWLTSSRMTSITTFTLFRWLAEASLLPHTLLIVACDPFSNVFDVAGCYFFLYVPTILVKVPLFVLMRCAEMRSDFFLNAIEILVFKTFYAIRQILVALSEQHSIQLDVFWCSS